jgi:Tfp pilus assembly protein PilF
MSVLDNLQQMLERGQDNVLLRFSLGNEYFKAGELAAAEEHLRAALQQDPQYSAAWKILGKVLVEAQRPLEAVEVFERGIGVAEQRGDIQAAKEMGVFLRRTRKALEAS